MLKIRRILTACVLALGAACPVANGAHLHVFLLAGQSNMVGGGQVDLPTFPADQDTYFPEILYTHNTDEGSEDWGPLQPRLTSNGALRRWIGPELTFGETLLDSGMEDIAMIKWARNGTSLSGNWCSADDSPCEGINNTLRVPFYEYVDEKLAALENMGHTYTIDGFIWVQGSGDAGVLSRAVAYDENLQQFVDEIEQRYNPLTTVINRYHIGSKPKRAFTDQLRESQREAGNSDPDLYVIHGDDLPLKSDLIHYTEIGHLGLGQRLATRYLQAQYPTGDYNYDGVVNLSDFTVWRNNLGSLSELGADGDGDGAIDSDDYLLWKAHFGDSQAGAINGLPASTAIPEPSSTACGAASLIALLAAKAKRHRLWLGCRSKR